MLDKYYNVLATFNKKFEEKAVVSSRKMKEKEITYDRKIIKLNDDASSTTKQSNVSKVKV